MRLHPPPRYAAPITQNEPTHSGEDTTMRSITHKHQNPMQTTTSTTLASSAARGRRGWRRARKLALGVAAVVLAMTGTTLLAGAVAKTRLKAKYPPIGQMVDVGGYQLHLVCQGTGSPTMILEAGAGGFDLHWTRVQPEVARTARVCAYDRAGYGWSDRSPRPRTAA